MICLVLLFVVLSQTWDIILAGNEQNPMIGKWQSKTSSKINGEFDGVKITLKLQDFIFSWKV